MSEVFTTEKIVSRILILSKDNSALSRLNRCFYNVAQLASTKAKWLLARPKLLDKWVSKFEGIVETSHICRSFGEWLAYRLFPPHQQNKLSERLLRNPEVLFALYINAVKNKSAYVKTFWNALASEGSMLGIAALADRGTLKTDIESDISMVTNAFYACIYQTEHRRKELGAYYINLLLNCRPMNSSISEYLQYAVIKNDKAVLFNVLDHFNDIDTLFASLVTSNLINKDAFKIMYDHLHDPDRAKWDRFERLLALVESDANDELTEALVEQRKLNDFERFDLELAALLEKAIRCKSKNVQTLLNFASKEDTQFYVPLGLFLMSIDQDDFEVAEKLVPFIDCLQSEKTTLIDRVNLILTQFSQIRPRFLFGRTYPFHDLSASPDQIRTHLRVIQCKCVEFLVNLARKLKPDFVIDSFKIWTAFQEGNFEVAQKLKDLGGVVQWMDSSSGQKIKHQLTTSGDVKYILDDSKSQIFQAYSGTRMEIDRAILAIEPLLEDDEVDSPRGSTVLNTMTSNTDYRHLRRPSAEMTDSQLKSHKLEPLVLGGRRLSNLPTERRPDRIAVKRRSSKANIESDTKWNTYFQAEKSGLKLLLENEQLGFQWMDQNEEQPLIPWREQSGPVDLQLLEMTSLY